MDPLLNPFSPGAGTPPPELVGRDHLIQRANLLLGRVRQGRAEKSFFLTGLRGVGKTVLLVEIRRLSDELGCRTILAEAHEEKTLVALLVPPLRRLLYDLDRMKGMSKKVKRALAVLKGFLGAFKVSVGDVSITLDIEPERGTADSGDLEVDLPELFVSVAEAAKDRNTLVLLMIDEVQYLKSKELSALIMAMHRMQQRGLPLVLIGAGLPILPGLAGESKSYAERLFDFPDVGPLSKADAAKAIVDPLDEADVEIEADALDSIFKVTKGYPYFVQEWGYQVWNTAEESPIRADIVETASPRVVERLDQNFFRVRFDRLTPREKEFLRAMAELGPGPYNTGDVADALGTKVQSLGPRRAQLISKGMIYSPSHGLMAFTVPLFDEFMKRAMPGD